MAVCGVLRGPIALHWGLPMRTVGVMAVEPNYTGAGPGHYTRYSHLTGGKHGWEDLILKPSSQLTQLSAIEATWMTGLFEVSKQGVRVLTYNSRSQEAGELGV